MSKSRIRCVMYEATDLEEVWLRRYIASTVDKCGTGYHNAMTLIGQRKSKIDEEGYRITVEYDNADPRWPVTCSSCGKDLTDTHKQTFIRTLYRNTETGELSSMEDMPVGAMWNATWLNKCEGLTGPDGLSLHVRLPDGHEWNIDGRASNCDMKDDHVHKCWVRHGVPPVLTVDKNGVTCHAGAGSIATDKYHGFLTDGYLVEC